MEFTVRNFGRLERAAVRFCDCATDGKSEPHAGGFSGHKGLK